MGNLLFTLLGGKGAKVFPFSPGLCLTDFFVLVFAPVLEVCKMERVFKCVVFDDMLLTHFAMTNSPMKVREPSIADYYASRIGKKETNEVRST